MVQYSTRNLLPALSPLIEQNGLDSTNTRIARRWFRNPAPSVSQSGSSLAAKRRSLKTDGGRRS